MIQQIGIVISGLLLYSLLCAAACLAGYGLVRLLRLATASPGMVLLAPGVALVFWSLVVGVAVGLRVPMKTAAPWLWGMTAILVLNGIRRPWPVWRHESALLLLCAALPIVVMAPYFWHGISDYSGSVAPDGWAYAAVGQYLWEYQRGTEGGLAPLYQFAAQFSNVRYISSSLLGFFSPLVSAGDTQTVSSLFQAWTLFCMTCAVGFFWITETTKRWMVVSATVLSAVTGWIANLVWANNFDNSLALTYLPAFAGIINVLEIRNWRWWILLGGMSAALAYTYPELTPLILISAMLIALPRIWQERHIWRAWLGGIVIGLTIAFVLVLPVYKMLATFALSQFMSASTNANRPGEGIFKGLLIPQYFPAALWGLGGEHQISHLSQTRNLLAIALTAIAVLGMLVLNHRHKWGLSAAIVLLLSGTLFFIVWQHYSYAAYKLIVISWWCIVVALITGIDWIIERVRNPSLKRITVAGLSLLLLFNLSQSNHINVDTTFRYISSPYQQSNIDQFRQLRSIKQIVGGNAVTVLVDDWLANNWAVYYLRDMPINLNVYRMYMAAPHRLPYMERAQHVPLETTRYILTDSNFYSASGSLHPWKMVWADEPYRLWDTANNTWAAIATITNANGIERVDRDRFFWMGMGDTSIEVLTNNAGFLHVSAVFILGPSVRNSLHRQLLVTTNNGYSKQFVIDGGDQQIVLPVQKGKTELKLRTLDQPSGEAVNGDPRPLVLGVKGIAVSLDDNPVAVEKIQNANGLEKLDGEPFFWMGQGPTTIRIQALQDGQLTIQATFIPGPSLPGISLHEVIVESDTGYHEQVLIAPGRSRIEVPVRAGAATIRLTPLGKPTQLVLANGDTRPLILGVKGLTAQIHP